MKRMTAPRNTPNASRARSRHEGPEAGANGLEGHLRALAPGHLDQGVDNVALNCRGSNASVVTRTVSPSSKAGSSG